MSRLTTSGCESLMAWVRLVDRGYNMTHVERVERQKVFFARWLTCRHIGPALRDAGIRWQHVQSWRRWDPGFRKRYDETQEKIDDVRHALRAVRKLQSWTRRQLMDIRVVYR